MLVKKIMTKNPKTVPPNTYLSKVVEEMKKLDCGFIPIAQNGKIIGVITDRDITLRAISSGKDPKNTLVKDIMTPKAFHVSEDDEVRIAAEKMCKQQIRRLVVFDKNNNITGVISLGDIATRCENPKIEAEIIEAVSENKQQKKAA